MSRILSLAAAVVVAITLPALAQQTSMLPQGRPHVPRAVNAATQLFSANAVAIVTAAERQPSRSAPLEPLPFAPAIVPAIPAVVPVAPPTSER